MKWEATFLTPGSLVYVRDLGIEFLEERLRRGEPFSFWKLNHAHWEWLLIAFMVAEKLVKASKTKADDILLDIVWANIKKLASKK